MALIKLMGEMLLSLQVEMEDIHKSDGSRAIWALEKQTSVRR